MFTILIVNDKGKKSCTVSTQWSTHTNAGTLNMFCYSQEVQCCPPVEVTSFQLHSYYLPVIVGQNSPQPLLLQLAGWIDNQNSRNQLFSGVTTLTNRLTIARLSEIPTLLSLLWSPAPVCCRNSQHEDIILNTVRISMTFS